MLLLGYNVDLSPGFTVFSGGVIVTSLAFDLAKQVETMSDPEFEFLWDVVRKRHNESLLSTLDMKLEESMNADSLS